MRSGNFGCQLGRESTVHGAPLSYVHGNPLSYTYILKVEHNNNDNCSSPASSPS
jgi:hypothetical protein